jgi:hypothetical protein
MAKAKSKSYTPNQEELDAYKKCLEKDIVYYIQQVTNMTGYFWVVRYKPSNYKSINYMRIDLEEKDTPKNRVVLNEYDAMKKCFEYYKLTVNKK